MRKELELPDLPDINDSESIPTKGLQVETTTRSANQDLEKTTATPQRNSEDTITVNTAITGLRCETPGRTISNAARDPNNEAGQTNIPETDGSDNPTVPLNVHEPKRTWKWKLETDYK